MRNGSAKVHFETILAPDFICSFTPYTTPTRLVRATALAVSKTATVSIATPYVQPLPAPTACDRASNVICRHTQTAADTPQTPVSYTHLTLPTICSV
eukprot:5575262-Prymnesium_polylepis.2